MTETDDKTAQIKEIKALKTKVKWYELVLNSISEGVNVVNKEGITTFYNDVCSKFEGLNSEKVVGKHIKEVYDLTDDDSVTLQVLKTGTPVYDGFYSYQIRETKKRVNIVASTFPLYEDGEVRGAYSVAKDITQLKEALEKTMKARSSEDANNQKTGHVRYTFEQIIAKSDIMCRLINSAKKAAQNQSSIMIYGETGTGKELFAQSIHNASQVSKGQFIGINCAAMPDTLLESILFGTVKGAFTGSVDNPGLFEQAGKGTLFLDEVNSMSVYLQAKLLRVLQEKRVRRLGDNKEIPVHCRIISSTNMDPLEAVSKGLLRQDLYYRLAVVTLHLPPLRERKDDISPLIKHFIEQYNKKFDENVREIDGSFLQILVNYMWPGNVRELEHVIESAMNMVDGDSELKLEHLPKYIQDRIEDKQLHKETPGVGSLSHTLLQVEKQIILRTLERNQWNISKTAKELGLYRQALQKRIKKLNITGK
ncbi:MAG: sigma 54-interacting transcriptional regulator [Bacillota bacterium]